MGGVVGGPLGALAGLKVGAITLAAGKQWLVSYPDWSRYETVKVTNSPGFNIHTAIQPHAHTHAHTHTCTHTYMYTPTRARTHTRRRHGRGSGWSLHGLLEKESS